MPNTYINDLLLDDYPLIQAGSLPISRGLLRGIGICIRYNAKITESDQHHQESLLGPVYVESISVGANVVQLVIGMRPQNNPDNSHILLGTLTLSTIEHDKSVLLQDISSDFYVSGFMQIGKILDTDIGQHTGPFLINPACITYMPHTTYQSCSILDLNGIEYTPESVLDITVSGLLHINVQNNKQSMIESNRAMELVDSLHVLNTATVSTYPMVTSVNGLNVSVNNEDSASSTLTIDLATDTATRESIVLAASSTDNCIIVTVDGTQKYPNCYASHLDQAIEAPEVV